MANSSKTSKEQFVSQHIMQLIQDGVYAAGVRLPSERRLAEKLGTSRNTLRNAMRQLQAHGVVDIRSGSGNYVLSKKIPLPLASHLSGTPNKASLAEVMEARFLVEPVIGARAAAMATAADIEGLEACLMRMSRASIDNLHDQMIREDQQFRKLLALSAKNRLMVSLHECIAGQGDDTLLGSPLPESDKASLFADYVGIFNAVQHRTPEHTHMSIQNHILRQCRLMVERHAIDMPGTITEALLRMQRDPDYEKPQGSAEP